MTPKRLVDWEKVARGVSEARLRTDLNQAAFGARYGLTQSQISDLERQVVRKLSQEVEAAITAILGSVPYLGLADLEEPELGPVGAIQKRSLDPRFTQGVRLLRTILSEGDEILRTAILNNLEAFARAAREHLQLGSGERRRARKERI